MKYYYRKVCSLLILVICPLILFAQLKLIPSVNYRIYPSNVTQTEVFIVKSPQNEDLLFSSCNTLTFIPFFVSEGIYVSDDQGYNWVGSDSCNGTPMDFHGGDPGIAIDKNDRFILTRLGRTPFNGLYAHYSYDKGKSWSQQVPISTDDLERAAIASDINSNSSYYGNTYASWVKFAFPFPMMFSRVGSDLEQWLEPIQINQPENRSAGGDIVVGTSGNIYTCWAGVADESPFKEVHVGFAISEDGGYDWNVNEKIFIINGITGLLPEKGNIRVNGLPNMAIDNTDGLRSGWIYIVTGQKNLLPAGTDPDIILNISTDGGLTWSDGVRVNQDAINNGKTQYFPTIHVDNYGAVNIIFYDDRNTSIDSTGVYLARSEDGGSTWREFEISDHNFAPSAIGGLGQGYQGDNIDMTSTEDALLPVWMDNSTGIYQIWSTRIYISDIDIINANSDKNGIMIYPNPSGDIINIKFDSHVMEDVYLKILDLDGNMVKGLTIQNFNAANNTISLSLKDLMIEDGAYLINLETGSMSITKKLILSK